MEELIKLRCIYAQYEKLDLETLQHVIEKLFSVIDKLEVGLYEVIK